MNLTQAKMFAKSRGLQMSLVYDEITDDWTCSFWGYDAYREKNGKRDPEYFEARKCSTSTMAITRAIEKAEEWYKQ